MADTKAFRLDGKAALVSGAARVSARRSRKPWRKAARRC